MQTYGKCPGCGNLVRKATFSVIPIESAKAKYPGVSFNCSICGVVLGISIDPILLKKQIVEEIVKALLPKK
jgi:hypothetical protein